MPRYRTAIIIDLLGETHFMYVPEGSTDYEKFLEDGIGVDGSSLPGIATTEDSDILALPDKDTKITILENSDEHEIYFTFMLDKITKQPHPLDVRSFAQKVDEELKNLGYTISVRPELEFYYLPEEYFWNVLKNPKKKYVTDYLLNISKDEYYLIRSETVSTLINFGIPVRYHHHENGPGQQEIELNPIQTIKRAGDAIALSRSIITKIAKEYGYIATFMPKPFAHEAGSGLHMHFYLFDENGENVFYNNNELSDVAKSFIAGVIKHAREITLLTNPTINSYKRLGAHEAPSSISWGFANRTAMIRIPASKKSIEVRNPDGMVNPYLAISAIVLAGLDGIKNDLKAPEPVSGSAYEKSLKRLPRTFEEALIEFENSVWTEKVLGIIKRRYLEFKKRELQEFLISITDWEIESYLTFF